MYDKYLETSPHYDLVVENETINLRSIFDFDKGPEELFAFLFVCEQKNCTVKFENEEITVSPIDQDNPVHQKIMLSLYSWVAFNHKIVDDYNRYVELCKKGG